MDGQGCRCAFIVLTGGPGAGKTATLEVFQKKLLEKTAVVPEAASVILSSAFWSRGGLPVRKAVQRAIFHMQREMESALEEEGKIAVALCDRGTLDGLAYWPDAAETFWKELQTTREFEFKRYAAVIHLRTPSFGQGYNHSNPIRTESAREAAEIDERILKAWEGHPNRIIVESADNFLEKITRALEVIKEQIELSLK